MAIMKTCCCGCMPVERGSRVIAILGLICGAITLLRDVAGGDLVSAAGTFLGVVASAALLIGVVKRKPGLVMAWVVVQALGMAYLAYTLVCLIIVAAYPHGDLALQYELYFQITVKDANSMTFADVVGFVIGVLILAGFLNVYFMVVVHSFYKQLKEEVGQGGGIEAGYVVTAPVPAATGGGPYPSIYPPNPPNPPQGKVYDKGAPPAGYPPQQAMAGYPPPTYNEYPPPYYNKA